MKARSSFSNFSSKKLNLEEQLNVKGGIPPCGCRIGRCVSMPSCFTSCDCDGYDEDAGCDYCICQGTNGNSYSCQIIVA